MNIPCVRASWLNGVRGPGVRGAREAIEHVAAGGWSVYEASRRCVCTNVAQQYGVDRLDLASLQGLASCVCYFSSFVEDESPPPPLLRFHTSYGIID
eukprot:6210321-Pleurochrysis_carterae.AAC.2